MDSIGEKSPTPKNIFYWFAPLALFIGSVVVYALNLDRVPHHDELYHILAARGILEFGEPRIADGLYERVYGFTWMLSKVFSTFGESLEIARLPSVLAMAVLVSSMFIWMRRVAGNQAALFGSLLFALSPFAVDMALFTRFYSLQALLFFCGACLIYSIVERSDKQRFYYFFPAILALFGAVYLQATTAIGVAGIIVWLMLRVGLPFVVSSKFASKKNLLILLVLGLMVFMVAIWSGLLAKIWDMYRAVPLFNKGTANEFWYYYVEYLKNYPTLWPAIALFGLIALSYHCKVAGFAIVVFVVSFFLSSFAAAKSLRYIVYAQPFLFVFIGIALAAIFNPLVAWLKTIREKIVSGFPFGSKIARAGLNFVFAGSVVFLIVGNPGFARAIAILADYPPKSDWYSVEAEIVSRFDRVDIVVTQAELEMLYYYGEYDVLYSPSRLGENPGAVDFDPDFRTGKPIIGSLQSMKLIFDCFDSGIFVTPQSRWRNPPYISTEVANLVVNHTEPLSLPDSSKMLAFVWNRKDLTPDENLCSGLPTFRVPVEVD